MKKIQFSFLLLLAGFSLRVSAQSIAETPKTQVQEVSRPQSPITAAAAKKVTAEMNNMLALDAGQQRMIFRTALNHEEQYAVVKESALTEAEKKAKFAALEAKKVAEFQGILTPEQMATYSASKAAVKE